MILGSLAWVDCDPFSPASVQAHSVKSSHIPLGRRQSCSVEALLNSGQSFREGFFLSPMKQTVRHEKSLFLPRGVVQKCTSSPKWLKLLCFAYRSEAIHLIAAQPQFFICAIILQQQLRPHQVEDLNCLKSA